ncbi:DUF1772 domain-containing protein [Formosa sp. Hel1_33_131]|jgi:hypothetical protein|uniref:DUF1772 domain-containing protein n=1 Tax=Formosa sp. Hel1_33_131 TaxID=1336794 RepID=UPI00084E2CAD|nr:DUF1772 domain-containing protein [Formosa sp. Hel1_33_131]
MNDVLVVMILFIMGAQFGIALTATVIVHPILVMAKKATAIEIFKPFFDKTHIWVLVSSIIVTVLALAYSIFTGNLWWFGVSLLMHLNGPYTIIFMMPLNRRLMDKNVDPLSEQTANDIKKWGRLHLVRTLLNGTILFAFIVLAVYM